MNIDLGLELYCIKTHGMITEGYIYRISGMGDLSCMHGTKKKGLGFCIIVDRYNKKFKDWWNHKLPSKTYYFTEKEADEFFCEAHLAESKTQITRHIKISKLV